MGRYVIKSKGTAKQLKKMDKVLDKLDFRVHFDENGIIHGSCDTTFMDLNNAIYAAVALAKAVPKAGFVFYGDIYNEINCGERTFDIEYDTKKLIVKDTGWGFTDDSAIFEKKDEEVEETKGETAEDDRPDYYWESVQEIDIDKSIEAKIVALIVNVTEYEGLGPLLVSNLPLNIDRFHEIKAGFSRGENKIEISVTRYISNKAEVDNFAEALSVVLPESKYVVVTAFWDTDVYKYTYNDGRLVCEKQTEYETFEEVRMVRLSDDQKAAILNG